MKNRRHLVQITVAILSVIGISLGAYLYHLRRSVAVRPQTAVVPPTKSNIRSSAAHMDKVGRPPPNTSNNQSPDLVNASLDNELSIIANRKESIATRVLTLERLSLEARTMSREQLERYSKILIELSENPSESPLIIARAIGTLVILTTIAEDRGFLSREDITKRTSFLIDISRNKASDINVRAQAILAIGNLQLSNGASVIEAILTDSHNLNIATLARSGCLSLLKLEPDRASALIAGVLSNTSDPTVFGTAAYCLGNIKNASSVIALLRNAGRFPDSPAVGSALVDLDIIIEPILEEPNNPNILDAITATRYLWQPEQEAHYTASLRALLSTAPESVRVAALDRLLEQLQSHSNEIERNELMEILPVVERQKALAVQVDKIQRRLSATVLRPNTAQEVTPIEGPPK